MKIENISNGKILFSVPRTGGDGVKRNVHEWATLGREAHESIDFEAREGNISKSEARRLRKAVA